MTNDNFVFIFKTALSKPVKQEVNGTMILPPLVFPALANTLAYYGKTTITALQRFYTGLRSYDFHKVLDQNNFYQFLKT
jgi:hypothetical protein